MAGEDDRKREKPRLRVVDDEPDVTRLGEAKAPPLEEAAPAKKRPTPMRRSDDQLASGTVMQPLGPSISSAATAPLDSDVTGSLPTAPLRIPPALIIVTAGGFFLLLGLGIFLAMGGRGGLAQREERSLQQKVEHSREEVLKEKQTARRILDEIARVLDGYCTATTVEEKARFARHPERVKPLMEAYYAEHEFDPRSGALLVEQVQVPMDTRSFTIFRAQFDEGPLKLFLAEIDNDLGVRIDWESDVCYQPIPIEEMLVQKPVTPTDIRVMVTPDHHYAFEFSDSEKYQCLKLTFRDSGDYLFGYVKRKSKTEKDLYNVFSRSQSGVEPMLLSVSYPENAHSDRAVLIERFICPRWAYTEDPQDE